MSVVVNERTSPIIVVVGQRGPAGTGDKTYEHTQMVAASTWNVAHNLGKRPSVTIIDTSGNECIGSVQHIDTTSLIITFSAAFSGKAICN